MHNRSVGFAGLISTTRTCREWCAQNQSVLAKENATCADPARQCEEVSALQYFIGGFTVDPAKLCNEACLVRYRRDSAGMPSLADEVIAQSAEAARQSEKAAKGLALTLTEWTGLLDKYRKAKAMRLEASKYALSLSPSHAYRKKLEELESIERQIDSWLIDAPGMQGFGVPAVAVVAGVGGGIVLAGFLAERIMYYLSEMHKVSVCTKKASEIVNSVERARFLEICKGTTDWTKVILVGGGVIGALGLGWYLWRRYK